MIIIKFEFAVMIVFPVVWQYVSPPAPASFPAYWLCFSRVMLVESGKNEKARLTQVRLPHYIFHDYDFDVNNEGPRNWNLEYGCDC